MRQNRWTKPKKKEKEGGANWRRQMEKEAAKARLDMTSELGLPPDSRKSISGLVESGIDMWGSRRVPPLGKMWMVEDEAEDEGVGETPAMPSEAERNTAPRQPYEPPPPPTPPEPVDTDPYGSFTKHVVYTIIRYRIYLDEDLRALFEAAFDDFPQLDRARLKRITDDIHKQIRDRNPTEFDDFIQGERGSERSPDPLEQTQKGDYPNELNTEDPYEVFAVILYGVVYISQRTILNANSESDSDLNSNLDLDLDLDFDFDPDSESNLHVRSLPLISLKRSCGNGSSARRSS